MAIGERIHFFRLLRGMTQKYLGMALGWVKCADGQLKNHLPKGLRRSYEA